MPPYKATVQLLSCIFINILTTQTMRNLHDLRGRAVPAVVAQ